MFRYNNQFLIVDYNLFNSSASQLPLNTVWILEQIPGTVARYMCTLFILQVCAPFFFFFFFFPASRSLLHHFLSSDDSHRSQDVTPLVNSQGYFGSYNTWYIPSIFNASGYPAMVQKHLQGEIS